jgi:hypothetical protein
LLFSISLFLIGCGSSGDGGGGGDWEYDFDFNYLLNGINEENAETVWVCDEWDYDYSICQSYLSFYEDGSGVGLTAQFFGFTPPDMGEVSWTQTDYNLLEVQSEEIGLWEFEFRLKKHIDDNVLRLEGDWIATELSQYTFFCGTEGGELFCSKKNIEDVFSELPPPTLINPVDNAIINQNEPVDDCPLDPKRGYGYSILFDWSGTSSEYDRYRLIVQKKDSSLILIDEFVSESEFLFVSCNSFIADDNLEDWEWFVLARDVDYKETKRGVINSFQFEPCRLDDGTPCSDDIRDFSDFTEFNFSRNPAWAGFCPPIDIVFSANITVNDNQEYVLNMSILEEGDPEVDVCLDGELILEGEYIEVECVKETQLEERLLTLQEIELVRSKFKNIEVFSTPDNFCYELEYPECLINVFEWDSFLANDSLCSYSHIPRSRSGDIMYGLLEGLRRGL